MPNIDVPYINQSVKYPTGCESVSTVMLLNYLGYDITVDEFIEEKLEKKGFQEKEGSLYGPDPYQYFVGSPYDPDSYGCYAPVICKALKKTVSEEYEVIDETGAKLSELTVKYIDHEMPVIIWACINMRQPVEGPYWKLYGSGKEFMWISNEHCMLLVGYDEENYYFNDPYENNGVTAYPKEVVADRYRAQHSQAVGVKKKP